MSPEYITVSWVTELPRPVYVCKYCRHYVAPKLHMPEEWLCCEHEPFDITESLAGVSGVYTWGHKIPLDRWVT
jgi:hypothetical protein